VAENILRGRHVLALAGTHGKTSTTSMLAWILECAGQQPGFLVGGVPMNFPVSARLGRARPFVIEADEFDTAFFDKRSKFVHYAPRTAVLNNLEFDHADIFDDLAAIERQFHHLLRIVPSNGLVVVNADDDNLQRVLKAGCWSEVRTFGASGGDYSFDGPPHDFEVLAQGRAQGRIRWGLSGQHNQMNALAAVAAAAHVGVPAGEAALALGSFRNVKRRMETRGVAGGVTVYDDFAHHPTAFRVTLDGLRHQVGRDARILSVFEPRTNTMRRGEMRDLLASSLVESDLAFCHAENLSWDPAQALAALGDRLQVSRSIPELVEMVCARARAGDHVLCMSNGGFGGIHGKLLAALARR
jgi:UDP-N-acetylmuramate: L-alanyl-gamma-D-glutamyl-meso-diaminopimelate ligase